MKEHITTYTLEADLSSFGGEEESELIFNMMEGAKFENIGGLLDQLIKHGLVFDMSISTNMEEVIDGYKFSRGKEKDNQYGQISNFSYRLSSRDQIRNQN